MKKLDYYAKYTDKLRKLIHEHPEAPIVCLVDAEVCGDIDGMWYAPTINFRMGEILNCEQDINDEKVFFDRDDFEESLEYSMADDPEYKSLSDEDFEKAVKEKLEEYEPYWTDVIQITATT